MKTTLGRSLTYANVMATIAVFIALGGGALAASTSLLAKNSVGTTQLKKGAVTASKVKANSLTGFQIDSSTLGTVPSATHSTTAGSATTAENSNMLQGKPASDFLVSGGTAQNSNQLGGMSASSFLGGPMTVRSKITEGPPPLATGVSLAYAKCEAGELAIGGGFQETGSKVFNSEVGFGSTYQLRGDSPGELIEKGSLGAALPHALSPGQTPTIWLVTYTFTAHAENPEVIVYADCVPNGTSTAGAP